MVKGWPLVFTSSDGQGPLTEGGSMNDDNLAMFILMALILLIGLIVDCWCRRREKRR